MRTAAAVSPETRSLRLAEPLGLECGTRLADVEVAYRTWGQLDAAGANAVVVCHALTGSADVDAWWGPLLGPGRVLDPERDFVVASNVLGGCYGTTGPLAARPGNSAAWGPDFPALTVRDLVAVQQRLLAALGVRRIRLVLGGSLGGMQALEWAALAPETVAAIAVISTSARHSAWCIGFSEAQRQAIYADPGWQGGRYDPAAPPAAGLAAARQIAMLSYRSRASLERRFGRTVRPGGGFAIEGYLAHQGAKLVGRFDANSYVALTRVMDSHDLGRGRGGLPAALASLDLPVLVVASRSDVLYPPEEQAELARELPRGELAVLDSDEGHDAFLIALPELAARLHRFRERCDQGLAEVAVRPRLRAVAGGAR